MTEIVRAELILLSDDELDAVAAGGSAGCRPPPCDGTITVTISPTSSPSRRSSRQRS
jgi:hypothetical protein